MHPAFAKCPRCLVKTKTGPGEADQPLRLALHLARVWRAEHDYQRHDAEREERGDPTPEALGILEARTLIALDRRAAA